MQDFGKEKYETNIIFFKVHQGSLDEIVRLKACIEKKNLLWNEKSLAIQIINIQQK